MKVHPSRQRACRRGSYQFNSPAPSPEVSGPSGALEAAAARAHALPGLEDPALRPWRRVQLSSGLLWGVSMLHWEYLGTLSLSTAPQKPMESFAHLNPCPRDPERPLDEVVAPGHAHDNSTGSSKSDSVIFQIQPCNLLHPQALVGTSCHLLNRTASTFDKPRLLSCGTLNPKPYKP